MPLETTQHRAQIAATLEDDDERHDGKAAAGDQERHRPEALPERYQSLLAHVAALAPTATASCFPKIDPAISQTAASPKATNPVTFALQSRMKKGTIVQTPPMIMAAYPQATLARRQ